MSVFITLSYVNLFGQNDDFTSIDLMEVAEKVDFEFVNVMKGIPVKKIPWVFSQLSANVLKQVNINAWAICDYSKIDNLKIYNYFYKDINRNTYEKYCRELNALMEMDGIIKSPK